MYLYTIALRYCGKYILKMVGSGVERRRTSSTGPTIMCNNKSHEILLSKGGRASGIHRPHSHLYASCFHVLVFACIRVFTDGYIRKNIQCVQMIKFYNKLHLLTFNLIVEMFFEHTV